jgi:fluoride exporter
MTGLFPVMIGGALGAGARYLVGFVLGSPWATLAVNLIGGLAMGLLIGSLAPEGENWRLFAGVGVLGGFTTFSAFGLESWGMIERGQFPMAALYVTASVVGAVLLTGLGLWITRA